MEKHEVTISEVLEENERLKAEVKALRGVLNMTNAEFLSTVIKIQRSIAAIGEIGQMMFKEVAKTVANIHENNEFYNNVADEEIHQLIVKFMAMKDAQDARDAQQATAEQAQIQTQEPQTTEEVQQPQVPCQHHHHQHEEVTGQPSGELQSAEEVADHHHH